MSCFAETVFNDLCLVLSDALLDKKLFNLDDPRQFSKLSPLFEKREAIELNLPATAKNFDGLRWCRFGMGKNCFFIG